MTGRRGVVSHTLLVAAALGVAQVLAYSVSVVAARALGPEQFGVLGALLGIILIGNVLALGIQAVGARRLVHLTGASRSGASGSILRDGLVGGIAIAVATVAVSPLLMWLLRIDGWLPLLLVAIAFIPLTWAGSQYGVAQGSESYLRLAAVYVSVGLGRGVGGVAGALLSQSVFGTMLGITLGTAAGALVGRWVVAPLCHGSRTRVDRFFAETAHATHALLALFVLTNIDVLLARALLSPEDAGEYALGAVIAKVAFWLPQFVGVVAFPRFADARRARATVVSLVAVGAIGAVLVAATALAPSLAVGIVGGTAYEGLAPVAWMFAAIGAVFALAQALLLTRLAVDDRRAVVAVWAAAACLVGLAWLVMPPTVTGLATSALLAGLGLAVIGVIATVVELRAHHSKVTAIGSGQSLGE